mmetsp:Transcript_33624/g.53832  ORF Transcript_33624/g.53832 Transcript_33624/m.53832 type:complete len:633 (+) Transcript_33624:159-2057(+)|eukprot:CAMPEP_0197026814 /NCGR_PEP_ID=MMETSP1384-20130603/6834_1 /TAXON_ID=29189 /ORGANISM="Ammonia sp." /LENGTH=632 /DNA_ID=CAMNT_0042455557 /DNA_START=61 /DNA_END=1959 /DNA_ORIENTATION=+
MQLEDDRKLFGYDDVSMQECEYQATQIFYTNEPLNAQEMDQITAVEYSRDGEHLAVGDRGGRIWIYSTNDGRNKCKPKPFNAFIEKYEDDFKSDALHGHSSLPSSSASQPRSGGSEQDEEDEEEEDDDLKDNLEDKDVMKRGLVYDFYGQFQSHQPEFDYLKSLEIEEKINCISWCRCANNSLSLLACNDKTIKLWKVFEKSMYRQSGSSFHKKFKTSSVTNSDYQFSNVSLPQIECDDIITAAISRRVYQNGHKFHIHSLDVNCDCETFISADDLRINLWHFDTPSTSFNLCDLKPDSMENLTNTITKAILHPLHCNYMAYTTSQSQICFCDMRQNCHIRNNNTLFIDNYEQYSPSTSSSQVIKNGNNLYQFASTKVFQYQQPLIHRDFFTDLASYISGITFTKDGNCMIVRDYFNAYVWDIRHNEKPLKIIPVHPYYANDMKHLYESDLLFDKFKVVSSPNSMSVATGTYNNSFVVANYETQQIQKCVLNANQVVAFQNKLKKNQKKLKKLKKLNKLKQKQKQHEKQSAASMDVDLQSIGKEVDREQRERDGEREDERMKDKDSDSKKALQQQQHEEEEEEAVAVKPSWLQSSYFQKGNFDQKTLHLSWHPKKDVIAAVSGSQLLIFQKL